MSYDRRTGKPIAVSVIRVDSTMVSSEILSEETFVGSVVQEAKPSTKSKNVCCNTNYYYFDTFVFQSDLKFKHCKSLLPVITAN